ncbi:hypothetical protein [Almyronema epifaneia]|uniref:Uncharacterized protein n=1 Tax=Almyronema epifaneia S1 TaxID=2991925 RepID=A0ABW6IIX8_9CYAN
MALPQPNPIEKLVQELHLKLKYAKTDTERTALAVDLRFWQRQQQIFLSEGRG